MKYRANNIGLNLSFFIDGLLFLRLSLILAKKKKLYHWHFYEEKQNAELHYG